MTKGGACETRDDRGVVSLRTNVKQSRMGNMDCFVVMLLAMTRKREGKDDRGVSVIANECEAI